MKRKKIDRRRFLKLTASTTALTAAGGTVGTFLWQDAHQMASAATTYSPPSSNRVDTLIDTGWKFFKGDVSGAQASTFNDSSWSDVNLPHTWNNIDGENGGTYYRGIAWYRLHYT